MPEFDHHRRPVAQSNFTVGRGGRAIDTIIIHTQQGSEQGTEAWFANPEAHASAHYGIGFDGKVADFVDDANTAWHSGSAEYNKRSIGIELEGFYERGRFLPEMMQSLITLLETLIVRYNIPRDRKHIIGHNEVPDPKHPGQFGGLNHHQDPGIDSRKGGLFPWGRIEDACKLVADVTQSAEPVVAVTTTATATEPVVSTEPTTQSVTIESKPILLSKKPQGKKGLV
jgi:N-acetyl-anhydromuramyl-L-alanine amidase AmpD